MKLSEHFTLDEFTRSATADARHIDNTLPEHLLDAAVETAKFMEGIRATLSAEAGFDVSVDVSSAYRCSALNTALGSKATSDHLAMLAVDFTAQKFGDTYKVAKALAPLVQELGIGQLIYEGVGGKRWVHVSRRPSAKIVNRVITISSAGVELGIQEVTA